MKLVIKKVHDWEYGVLGEFDFYQCPICGLMVLFPMPTLEELKTFYPEDYHGFYTSDVGVISFLYRLVYYFRFQEYLKLVGQRGRLLDVGCADAPYFNLLREQCPEIECVGIEFKDEIATKGRAKGRNIITGTFSDLPDSETFDLIIMNNLIEHVLDPVHEMQLAHAHLKKEGYLILETPNYESWDFYLAKKFWGGLHVPRHTFLFSPCSLALMSSKVGFVLQKTFYLLNTDHWSLSVQNFLQNFSTFRCPIKKGRTWYYKYLLFAFIPLNYLQKLFRRTGVIKAVLKKV
ncbi:MAG: class I SAM-dependent methyltransferase [Nitrospirota bacterium]